MEETFTHAPHDQSNADSAKIGVRFSSDRSTGLKRAFIMVDSLTTRPSLLVRVRDARDAEAWSQFVDLYAPLIYGFARKHRLQDADAADLTQDVLRDVAAAVNRLDYDPARGSFRGWLFTVVRNQLRTFLARRHRQRCACGNTGTQSRLEEQPAPESDPAALWDQECERRLFGYAARQVRRQVEDSTWQAFWQTSVEDRSAREVAGELGMTVAAVYMAKSRVVARLKELIQSLQGE
jgi:RNA polymerase sigma factor (sigma-70 family)